LKGIYIRSVYYLGVTAGGSVTHTSGVINALSKKVTLDVFANEKLVGVDRKTRVIPAILKNIPVFGELFYNILFIRKINKKKINEYQFVYQRYSGESFCGAFLANKYKIPFILEFNSSEVWKLKNWSKTNNTIKNFFKKYVQLPIVKKIEAYNLKRANIIVVVSDVLKENLTAIGVPPEKILVNPNGVDLERFTISPSASIIKDKFNLQSHYIFGFIGTFGKWHGVVELAKSIVIFFDKNPELIQSVKFLIMGDGKLFPEVSHIINTSEYSTNIILTGQIPQAENADYLHACDAFVSPHIPNPDGTKFFGSPTKLFEYMACNKPIIASSLDQIGEILEHNQNAYLVEPGNIDALVNSYQHVYSNTNLQQTLAENSYALVKEKYSWDNHVANIISRINQLPTA
jgi:glycosyltransferase involved in cell wall biosynthesis